MSHFFFLTAEHDLQDFFIRLTHTLSCQSGNVADGFFHALGDQTVPAEEFYFNGEPQYSHSPKVPLMVLLAPQQGQATILV